MSNWNQERVDRVRELLAIPFISSGEVAAIVSGEWNIAVSRGAIIGKCQREGIPLALPKGSNHTASSSYQRVKRGNGVRVYQPRSRSFTPKVTPMKVEPLNIATIALEEHHCRQVTSAEGEPYHFCGHPRTRGWFCADHAAINYLPAPPPKPRPAHYGKRFAA